MKLTAAARNKINGSPVEKEKVRVAVHRKFPGIGKHVAPSRRGR